MRGVHASNLNMWSLRECAECGREFKGCGPQSRCRKRDCGDWRDANSEATKDRLHKRELADVIAEQRRDMLADLWSKPGRSAIKRGASATGSYLLSEALTEHGNFTRHDVIASDSHRINKAVPGYLLEWFDPTFDVVWRQTEEVRVEAWLDRPL